MSSSWVERQLGGQIQLLHPELRVGLCTWEGLLCSPHFCAASVGLTGPVLMAPCRLSKAAARDVFFLSLSCRFSITISLSTQTGTQGSSQPNAQNTGVCDVFWDLPRVFLRRNRVKSELENNLSCVLLPSLPPPIKPKGLVNIYAFSFPTAQRCCGTAKTPGKKDKKKKTQSGRWTSTTKVPRWSWV